ncbi:Uncharacterised protein [Burkholderia pseudomallei]|nr:Uncharacterised protein [Burkholderia pseudomallei]CAJ8167890.1 Uncharacterised protein [Burkholderia pseudomallei]CAJ9571932.1 Uncharacterised protein [Burkholderia pseudomallei]VCQ90401.1 Uncharacterised protein [Burkholderia pseudomallei]
MGQISLGYPMRFSQVFVQLLPFLNASAEFLANTHPPNDSALLQRIKPVFDLFS